jgi:cytochrome P450
MGSLAAFDRALKRSGDVVDPLPVLEGVLGGVVAAFYFGNGQAEKVRDATRELLEALSAVFGSPFALPAGWPTPANTRIRRRYHELRQLVSSMIDAEVTRQPAAGDGYAASVARSAVAAGHPLDRIVDLLIGSLLAAQRVPAAGASWALLDIARSLEHQQVGREPAPCLRELVAESLRLHPPTWLLRRVATRQVSLGGFSFGAGHNFLVSPYVIHRDPYLYSDPEAFKPLRWRDATASTRQGFTFGGGVHLCPGRDMGTLIMEAAVAAVLQRWEIRDQSQVVIANPRTTLVPDGLRLSFAERHKRGEPGSRRVGLGTVRPTAGLDSLGESLPSRLPRHPEHLPNLGPGDLSGAR